MVHGAIAPRYKGQALIELLVIVLVLASLLLLVPLLDHAQERALNRELAERGRELLEPKQNAVPAKRTWRPVTALPPGAIAYPLGEELLIGDLAMWMRGFVSRMSPAEVAAWLQARQGYTQVSHGADHVLMLGRVQAGYVSTVKLTALGEGTHGVLADSTVAYSSAHQALLRRFPVGSRWLVATPETGEQTGSYFVLENRHGPELNRSRLIEVLAEAGLLLERDVGEGLGRILFFRGGGKRAVAAICGDGGRVIVAWHQSVWPT